MNLLPRSLGLALAALSIGAAPAPRPAASAPRPAASAQRAVAIFAGGCFWCTEADFDRMPGVLSTVSGYIGGRTANPTYEQVSAGGTGHIEAVRVVYDPRKIGYSTLVSRFFRTIDPLNGDGQFCDRGSQYRSALFFSSPQQRAIAEAARARAAREIKVRGQVATLILPASRFYPAEAYHQDYYRKNPVRYKYYRYTCGRDARLKQLWGS